MLYHSLKFHRIAIFTQIFFGGFFLFVIPASASSLYLEPKDITLTRGDTVTVEVRIDTQGQCVNVVEGLIHYDQTLIKATEFSRGESLLSLWVKAPEIDTEKGLIRFSGGIPGGYCGRVAGDPGLTNLIGRIAFTVPGFSVGMSPMGTGTSAIVEILPESTVFLNDGKGTKSALSTYGMKIGIAEGIPQGRNDWLQKMRDDKTLPEFFQIEMVRDPTVVDNKAFIVFSTTDKQSGIDHYEIKEADPVRSEFKAGSRQFAVWVPAESPYVLEDQDLKSRISVRAIDNAGNSRVAELVPSTAYREPLPDRGTRIKFFYLGVIGLIFCIILWRISKRKEVVPETEYGTQGEELSPQRKVVKNFDASPESRTTPQRITSDGDQHRPPPTRLVIPKR